MKIKNRTRSDESSSISSVEDSLNKAQTSENVYEFTKQWKLDEQAAQKHTFPNLEGATFRNRKVVWNPNPLEKGLFMGTLDTSWKEETKLKRGDLSISELLA